VLVVTSAAQPLLCGRLLLVAGDASTALLEGGKATWVREEALGAVTGSLALDLPAPGPELAAQARADAPSLSERLHAEVLSLKVCTLCLPCSCSPLISSWRSCCRFFC
jgi:hypothetical protein